MKKKIVITVDFEGWEQISYLEKYNFICDFNFCDYILEFFKYLKGKGIPATVFVVGSIVKKNKKILTEIKNLGFEIACHSFSHRMINSMTNEDFENDLISSINIFKDVLNVEISGFRAPSFSMSEEKLKILWSNGINYDSSYIPSLTNEYSNIMNLSNEYENIDSKTFKFINGQSFVYEMPMIKMFGKNRPIGGGGYFRLFPFFVYKYYVKKYFRNNDLFIFYIHPFELAGTVKFPLLKKLNLKDKIRFQIGRKQTMNKLIKLIDYFNEQNYIYYSLNNLSHK